MVETEVHSIVLYENKSVQCVELIDLAFDYFERHGIFIYEAFMIKWNNQISDFDMIPTNRKDLKKFINKEHFDFSISGNLEDNNCYFSYSTKAISGVNNVMMGISKNLIDSFTKKIEIDIAEKSKCLYGYLYVEYSWSKAILYANDNFVTPYDYEISGKWQNFIRFNEKEIGEVMRLVYHQNFISTFLLNRDFNGMTLKNWIQLDNNNNGKLENIDKDLWKWTIDYSELYRVNEACAENNLLISFCPSS